MDRRTFLALLGSPAVASVLQSCGTERVVRSTGSSRAEQLSDAAEIVRQPPAGDPLRAAEAFNDFGGALYRLLVTENPSANVVFSPISIALALAMTSAGARGQTLDEMLRTLHVDAAGAASLHPDTKSLSDLLAAQNNADVALTIANSLWGGTGFSFEQAFLDLLAASYGAGMNTVDYAADPEAARGVINQWVSDRTRARIPQLLPPGLITTDTVLTLVNAIYMKAPWASPFSEVATTDLQFSRWDRSMVSVPAMRKSASYVPYAAGLGWQAIELQYGGGGTPPLGGPGQLSMVIVVADTSLPGTSFAPRHASDADVTAQDAQLWNALTSAIGLLRGDWVDIALPRFDIEFKLGMRETLSSLGMPLAFTDSADFSAITTQRSLMIDEVIHQANITVDEKGTEAAAATAVILLPSSGPPDNPIRFVVDRTFLFAVRERSTGAVLFAGRVADPSIPR
jgi:serpin B